MKTVMNFPEWKEKALTFSYDDGVKQDLRLKKIFDKYGLKCTFNINTGLLTENNDTEKGRMTRRDILENFCDGKHELAVHTLTHPFLEKMQPNRIVYEVTQDIANIEEMCGKITRGMAYPYGTYNDTVVEALKNCGIVYSRTTLSTEAFTVPTNWLKMPATCHHKNPKLTELADRFLASTSAPLLFYVWGHSYEFDDKNNWDVIERFAEKMAHNEQIWYATNIEIYDYVSAYNALVFSFDGKKAYNPTATAVFFSESGNKYVVAPGETVVLK